MTATLMAGSAEPGRDCQACATLAAVAVGTRPVRRTAGLWRRTIELRTRAARAIARTRAPHQHASELIDESRRLRRVSRIPLETQISAPQSSSRPNAVTLRGHLAWHLIAVLVVLTGQLAPKRHRPFCRRRLRGSRTDHARVEQTAHPMAASARRPPGSRRTPGPLRGRRCSLMPVCSNTPPAARQTDATQRAGVGNLFSELLRDPDPVSASIVQAGALRSAP